MEAVKPYTLLMPYKLYEELDTFCKSGQFTKAHIMRIAIERELQRRKRKLLKIGAK